MQVTCSVVVERLVGASQLLNAHLQSILFSLLDHVCSEPRGHDKTLNLVPVVFTIHPACIVMITVDLTEVFFGHLALFKSDRVSRVCIWVINYVWEPHDFLRENRLIVEKLFAIIRYFLFVHLAILVH